MNGIISATSLSNDVCYGRISQYWDKQSQPHVLQMCVVEMIAVVET